MLVVPGTPFWKLVLKQFDDLLVKVSHLMQVQPVPVYRLIDFETLPPEGIYLSTTCLGRFYWLRQSWTLLLLSEVERKDSGMPCSVQPATHC